MIGIYAGRFQPFHLGHLESLEYIMNKAEETFVCICSKKGDSPLDDRNPFEYDERKNMIELSLGILPRVHFKHVKDQDSDEEWTQIIEKEMPKGRKVSFSNNPHTISAFKEHGYETQSLPIKYDNLNATLVRKLIIRNEKWEHLVPFGTWKVVEEIRNEL